MFIISAAKDQTFLAEAPLLLVLCANPLVLWKALEKGHSCSLQDATIALAYAQLTVHVLGLSTVWVGAFDERKVSEILHRPQRQRPVAMLPIGYKNEKPKEKATRGSKDLLNIIN